MGKKLAIAMFGQKHLSREGGVEIVVKELCTRMAQNGCDVTCYNRSGHHVSGAEYDDAGKTEYEGIRQKSVPTIERRGLTAVSSSFFAALCSAFGKYDVVHIHAEGPAFFSWLPKMFGKRVVVTVHGIDWQREKWQSGLGSKFIHQGEKNAAKYADEVIVLSKEAQNYFKETYGRETHFIPNGVNRPQIREASLITDKGGRNVDKLAEINNQYHIILVVSSVTESEKDSSIRTLLENRGNVTIIDSYLQSIQEIYQLADVYLFPVMDIENCIDVPLSVLEAASCNLPIVTTEYGELTAFREQEGFLFIDALDSDSLNQALEKALLKTEVNNRQAVLEYDWKNSIDNLQRIINIGE